MLRQRREKGRMHTALTHYWTLYKPARNAHDAVFPTFDSALFKFREVRACDRIRLTILFAAFESASKARKGHGRVELAPLAKRSKAAW